MLRIHYYRYDQDYTGWDLWLWEKGSEGQLHMFHYQEPMNGDVQKAAKVAEIDVTDFKSNELGVIIRKGNWHERDLYLDRYFTITEKARTSSEDIYLVQDNSEVFRSENEIGLSPGFETAIFENFREILVRLQSPARQGHDTEPFHVYEDGLDIPIRHVTPTRGAKEFILSLENDMEPGSTYMLYKPGYRISAVAYGMIYDTPEFERLFDYEGNDLGSTWQPDHTSFKVWAPTASALFLNLYETGLGSSLKEVFEMKRGEKGVWSIIVPGDLSGVYYTYTIMVMCQTFEAADPYARSSGVNGERSMVADPVRTNPPGWEKLGYKHLVSPTDAILYELHIRDISIHESSGIKNRGKYIGLSERDTRSAENMPTGLSHLMDLGVTHVHLMPVADFCTIDEIKPLEDQYNWGYDPLNFNVPEGSYASDPYDGYVRVTEMKQMIQSIKSVGMGVVMDVVYNHTFKAYDSDFNKLVPGYYFRSDRYGAFSDGSGCGNETASERIMVRRFMTNSVKRWALEYKVDGFRFDLMGLHDLETMNEIRMELDKISASFLLYGEGWTGGPSPLTSCDAAVKNNAPKLNKIGFFNDNTRDAIKGDAFHQKETGFITGNFRLKESVKFGVAGAVYHPGVDYSKVNYSGFAWASCAWHCVNYAASHDNLTLYDKLKASRPDLSDPDYRRLVNLAAAIVLTSQGIPFFMLGTDMMRSKKGEHNSYHSPDEINQVDWALKFHNEQVFSYHKGLICLRKAHPAFRMTMAEEIRRNLVFHANQNSVISFSLHNHANQDPWECIFVAYNAGEAPEAVSLPFPGVWGVAVDENRAGNKMLGIINGETANVAPRSALVLFIEDKTKTGSTLQ